MKICSIEKITDEKYLNLVSVQYRDRQDKAKTWVFASRGNSRAPDAVVVVPFHEAQGKLVMIREFRMPLQDFQYGFPAGLVDKGESVEDAGQRELYEETGLKIRKILGQSPAIYSSSGMTDESITLLYASCDGNPSTRFNEDSEEIEVLMLDRNAARDLLNQPGLKFDVKSWIILERFVSVGSLI